MKNFKILTLAISSTLLTLSCSNDDDALPQAVNEEEVITTLTVTLTPQSGGTPITMQTRDLDGDGPNAPVVTVSGSLNNGITYDGSIKLLNETVNPAEDITEEVEEEADEHQFFYTPSSSLAISTAYSNYDSNANPLGTEFTLTTNLASTGTLTFTLRHEPNKPNSGLANAGGETDIEASFDVTVL